MTALDETHPGVISARRMLADARRALHQPSLGDRAPGITLVLGGRRPPRGQRVHLLAGRQGPMGELLCVNSADEIVALFDAQAVIDCMETALREAGLES